MNELLRLNNKYGSDTVTAQLEQAIGKGWQSIALNKFEQYNDVIVPEENDPEEEQARRLDNMRLHAKKSGESSTWMNSKYSEQYRKVLESIKTTQKRK